MNSLDIPWCYISFKTKNFESFLKQRTQGVKWSNCNLKKDKIIPKAFAYFVELSSLEKQDLNIIANLAKRYKNSHIHLFTSKSLQTLTLYRFALHIKAKSVQILPINDETVFKLFQEAKINIENEIRQEELSDVLTLLQNNLPFIYYREKEIKLISDPAKNFFGKNILKSSPSVDYFGEEPFVSLKNKEAEDWKSFRFICKNSKDEAVCFFPFEKIDQKALLPKLNHRFEAIEWLKNQFSTHDGYRDFTFVLFHLENCGIVQKQLEYLDFHEWNKKILRFLAKEMSSYAFLAKWSEAHCLICYDKQTQVEDKIDQAFEKLINFTDSFVPIFETHIWRSTNDSLNRTIDTLDALSCSQNYLENLNELNITIMHSEDDSLSESEKIFRMLYACIIPKTVFKLQNIYKGLCINTSSRVLGEKDGMIYLECQPTQAYAVKQSRSVTILSDMFIHDIHASVKLVDIEKRFIVVDEFHYLDTSANNRQYTRVQTRVRTPISLKQERLQFQGDIIDISLRSLAFATRLPVDELKYRKGVAFNFHLPDETSEDGFCPIRGVGEIIYIGKLNSRENKIVVMMNLKNPYDSHLLRYMYMRQKELIEELKNISKTITS